ncbi:hypothetical protein CRG98_006204, partial [Punica granatum]
KNSLLLSLSSLNSRLAQLAPYDDQRLNLAIFGYFQPLSRETNATPSFLSSSSNPPSDIWDVRSLSSAQGDRDKARRKLRPLKTRCFPLAILGSLARFCET